MGIPDSQRVGIWTSDADVNIGEGKMLYDPLEDDERLMGCQFRPDMHATGGFTNMLQMGSLRKGVGVATDRRVLFLGEGVFSEEVSEIPYTSIESISYGAGVMNGGVKVSAHGITSLHVEAVKPKESARTFADVVRSHLTARLT